MVNEKIYSAPFCTSRITVQLIPRAPLKTTSTVLLWQGFSLMKFCKCQNFNSLFGEISFPKLLKYSWNLQILSIIEKFNNRKILLKNSWKIVAPFGRWIWHFLFDNYGALFWVEWSIFGEKVVVRVGGKIFWIGMGGWELVGLSGGGSGGVG